MKKNNKKKIIFLLDSILFSKFIFKFILGQYSIKHFRHKKLREEGWFYASGSSPSLHIFRLNNSISYGKPFQSSFGRRGELINLNISAFIF